METPVTVLPFDRTRYSMQGQCSAFKIDFYFKRDIKLRLYTEDEILRNENKKTYWSFTHKADNDLRASKESGNLVFNHRSAYKNCYDLIMHYWREDRIKRACVYETFCGQKIFQFNEKGYAELISQFQYEQSKSGHITLLSVTNTERNYEIPSHQLKHYFEMRKRIGRFPQN